VPVINQALAKKKSHYGGLSKHQQKMKYNHTHYVCIVFAAHRALGQVGLELGIKVYKELIGVDVFKSL
jgi:hypothetical protein